MKEYQFLVLYDGKLYQADLGSTVDIHGLTPVEITTHLTDKGITYSIDKGITYGIDKGEDVNV